MIWSFYVLLELFVWNHRLRELIVDNPLIHIFSSALNDVLWIPVALALPFYMAHSGLRCMRRSGSKVLWLFFIIIGTAIAWIDALFFFKIFLFGAAAFYILWLLDIHRHRQISLAKVLYAVVLLSVLLHYNSALLPHPAFSQAGDLRIMTFNMNSTMALDDMRTGQFIREHLPDIIFLQELNAREKSFLLSDLKALYPYHYGVQKGVGDNDVLILSKKKIISGKPVPLETPYSEKYKTASHVIISYDNQSIHLINCHFSHPVRFLAKTIAPSDSQKFWFEKLRRADLKRRNEARILADYARALSGPVIIAGDFNDTPNSAVYNSFATAFTNAFTNAGYGLGTTFGEWKMQQSLPGVLQFLAFDFLRIDHIFCSQHFKVKQTRVADLDAFDHRPLIAILQLKTKR